MPRVFIFILSIVTIPWLFSARAVAEATTPNGPHAGVLLSPDTPLRNPSTNARLAGASSSLNITPSSNPGTTHTAASPFSTSTSNINDSDPSITHKSSPVAMIGGSLAVFIAVLAAVLVICLTRRKKNNKRRRRQDSVIRELEAHLAQPNLTSPQIEDYPRSGTDALSGMSPPRRPSSIRASTRESGRTSKKKHSFRGSRYTSSHLSNSPTDDIELDYRHSKAASPRVKETPQTADRLTHTGSVDTQTQSTVNPSSFFSSGTIASNLGDHDHDSDTFIFGGDADGKPAASAPGHPLPVTHPHPKPQPPPHPHHPLARSQDRSRPLSNEGTTGLKASFKASAGYHTVRDESSGGGPSSAAAVVPVRSAYLSRSPLSSPVHTVVQGDLPPAYEDIR